MQGRSGRCDRDVDELRVTAGPSSSGLSAGPQSLIRWGHCRFAIAGWVFRLTPPAAQEMHDRHQTGGVDEHDGRCPSRLRSTDLLVRALGEIDQGSKFQTRLERPADQDRLSNARIQFAPPPVGRGVTLRRMGLSCKNQTSRRTVVPLRDPAVGRRRSTGGWDASHLFYCPEPVTNSIVFPQQHVGFWVPGQSGGALLVTVTSQPQTGSGHR